MGVVLFTNCRVFGIKTNCGCCCVKFIAVPSFVYQFELVSYINIHVPLFFDVVYTQIPLLSQHVHVVYFIRLYPCTMCGVC